MWHLLTLLLWGVSFATLPFHANGFWAPKEALWLLGSFLLGSSIWWNAPTRPGVSNRTLGWCFAWVLISFGYFVLWPQLLTPQTLESQVRLRWYVSPILPTLTLLGSCLAYDALVRHTDSLLRWHRVALHLVRIGSLTAIWAIAQASGLDPFEFGARAGSYRLSATSPITMLGNQTLTGNFLALCAPLALMFRAWRYRWGAFALMVLAIVLTKSASSLLAVWGAALLVMALQRRWGVAIGLLLGTMGIGGIVWHHGSLAAFLNPQGRVEMWQTALTLWWQHPLNAWIGFGAGSVGALTYNGTWTYGFLHNDLIQFLFEFGLIGAGLAMLALLTWLASCRHLRLDGASSAWMGAALAYGLISLTNSPMQMRSMLMVGVVIAAAVSAYAAHSEDSDGQIRLS